MPPRQAVRRFHRTGRGLADHEEVAGGLEDSLQTLTENGVVVDQQDSDHRDSLRGPARRQAPGLDPWAGFEDSTASGGGCGARPAR